jgi:8-oxo-dGTP diphosphatase
MTMTERDSATERPKVGMSLLVVRRIEDVPHVLLGKRHGAHGEGEWGTPGGHLEHAESFAEGALSELEEECGEGLEVSVLQPLCITNLRDYLPKHYIDVALVCDWVSGEPELMEPDKCERWGWFPLNDLPQPLFGAVENMVTSYESGQFWFD